MKILVICKQSFLEMHRPDRRTLERLRPADRARFIRADIENRQTVRRVVQFLKDRGLRPDVVFRGGIAARKRYDLVITLGGDGTFFAAAHHVRETPLVAINSDPDNSLALFAAGDKDSFPEVLDLALSGRLKETSVARLEVRVNGKPVPTLVTNDVLFTHRNPAAMSRYRLGAGRVAEEQKSSGVWISSAAGSTAGIRGAGGRRMPITSREIQYCVREPYGWPRPRYRLLRGCSRGPVTLDILMLGLALWIDGRSTQVNLTMGDRVEIAADAPPLRLLGYDDRRRAKLFP